MFKKDKIEIDIETCNNFRSRKPKSKISDTKPKTPHEGI